MSSIRITDVLCEYDTQPRHVYGYDSVPQAIADTIAPLLGFGDTPQIRAEVRNMIGLTGAGNCMLDVIDADGVKHCYVAEILR